MTRSILWFIGCLSVVGGCHSLGTPGEPRSCDERGAPPRGEVLAAASELSVHFVGIRGGGEAIVIDYGDTEILIDGGSSKSLVEYLRREQLVEDGKIELMVLTHPDLDHYAGLHKLLKTDDYEVLEYWDPGYDRGTAFIGPGGYEDFLEDVRARVPCTQLKRPLEHFHQSVVDGATGDEAVAFSVGQRLRLRLLYSEKAPQTNMRGPRFLGVASEEAFRINNASIVIRLEYVPPHGGRQVNFLFTGDINGRHVRSSSESSEVEGLLLAKARNYLKADVLKLPHHGSNSANTPAFLDAVHAKYAVVTMHRKLGAGPPYEAILDDVEGRLREGGRLYRAGVSRTVPAEPGSFPHRARRDSQRTIVCTVVASGTLGCHNATDAQL